MKLNRFGIRARITAGLALILAQAGESTAAASSVKTRAEEAVVQVSAFRVAEPA